MVCQRNGNKFLIYTDNTPQKDAIIATPEIVVKITTLGEKKWQQTGFTIKYY